MHNPGPVKSNYQSDLSKGYAHAKPTSFERWFSFLAKISAQIKCVFLIGKCGLVQNRKVPSGTDIARTKRTTS